MPTHNFDNFVRPKRCHYSGKSHYFGKCHYFGKLKISRGLSSFWLNIFFAESSSSQNSDIFVKAKRVSLFRKMSLFGVSLFWMSTVFLLYFKKFLSKIWKIQHVRVLTFLKKQFLNLKVLKPGVCTWSLISLNNLSANEKNGKIQKSN